MATDKLVQNLIINKMTKAQYESIEPSDTELYFITDDTPFAAIATNESVGVVKPDGSTITIAADGTLSATAPIIDTSNLATKEDLFSGNYSDLVGVPNLATVATSGSYNDLTNKPTIPSAYTLPTASTSTLGGVKVDGTTITIANGIISAAAGSSDWTSSGNTTTGYLKHNKSSFMFQWLPFSCKVTTVAQGGYLVQGSTLVNFPTAFSNRCLYIISMDISPGGGDEIASVGVSSKTNFKVTVSSVSAGTYTATGNLLAIGI